MSWIADSPEEKFIAFGTSEHKYVDLKYSDWYCQIHRWILVAMIKQISRT